MIKVNRRDRDSVSILELAGRLMGGPDSELFQKTLRDLMAEGRFNVVVDLGQVAWVNSSGLGILIASFTALKEKGGSLKLLNVSRRIEQILAVTKLSTVFETYSDEDAVVASFK
jgi:anti-sigma B factor antagonist